MSTKVITLNIPESANIDDKEVAIILASGLYEKGKLSLGQAADVAGLTKRTFTELLGLYGVSIFNCPETDLLKDIENA